MPAKNLVIGFGACALVLGAVGAVASGIDWDPRDVEASERYRERERDRADRYRGDNVGDRLAQADSDDRDQRRLDRNEAREARREARRVWWDEQVEGFTGSIETDGWRGFFENWSSWWQDEAAPAWEDWAERQDDLVSDGHRLTPEASSPSEPTVLPRPVERMLEESLAPEEMEQVRRGVGEAADWWAEERDRMRSRRGDGGDR
jgi:hypothetical protein